MSAGVFAIHHHHQPTFIIIGAVKLQEMVLVGVGRVDGDDGVLQTDQ